MATPARSRSVGIGVPARSAWRRAAPARASRSVRSIRFGGPVVPLVSIRTATPGAARRRCAAPSAGATVDRRDRARASVARAVGGSSSRARAGEVVGRAGEQRRGRARRCRPGAARRRGRVDRDHAARRRAAAPSSRPTRRGPVAQHEPDRRAGAGPSTHRGVDRVGRGASSPHGRPRAVELERGRGRIERQHLGDALGESRSVHRHRILGVGVRSTPVRATSAMPIGLPSRV